MLDFVYSIQEVYMHIKPALTPERMFVLLWIGSAAVQALPPPVEGGSGAYLWLYRFSHAVAANLKLIGKAPKKAE